MTRKKPLVVTTPTETIQLPLSSVRLLKQISGVCFGCVTCNLYCSGSLYFHQQQGMIFREKKALTYANFMTPFQSKNTLKHTLCSMRWLFHGLEQHVWFNWSALLVITMFHVHPVKISPFLLTISDQHVLMIDYTSYMPTEPVIGPWDDYNLHSGVQRFSHSDSAISMYRCRIANMKSLAIAIKAVKELTYHLVIPNTDKEAKKHEWSWGIKPVKWLETQLQLHF